MTSTNFKDLIDEYKVIYFLVLSEKVVPVFTREDDQKIARDVINKCWEWIHENSNIGESLYDLLDDEDKGITILQEMSDVDKDKIAWNCIIDAVAYTSRKAYQGEGVKYFPEPIALVDDTLIDHFIDCFNRCVTDSESQIQHFDSIFTNLVNNGQLKTQIREAMNL